MCPNDEVLSAFFDGELYAVRKEKIAAHVDSCKSCREKLAAYSSLREKIKSEDIPVVEQSRIKTWEKIQKEQDSLYLTGFWKRKLIIPFPVAAIIFIFIFLSGLSLFISLDKKEEFVARIPHLETVPVHVNAHTMEDLAGYFNYQDLTIEIHIKLPDSPDFSFIGEPQLLRAADYKREKN